MNDSLARLTMNRRLHITNHEPSVTSRSILTIWNTLKGQRVALAFAVLIGGVLTVRFGAPPLPVLLGCVLAVFVSSVLNSIRARR